MKRQKNKTFFLKVSNFILEFVSGNWLANKFFTERFAAILWVVLLTVLYIANGFHNEEIHNAIAKSRREISKLTVTSSTTRAERISITKESNIIDLLRKNKIELYEIDVPPLTITSHDKTR